MGQIWLQIPLSRKFTKYDIDTNPRLLRRKYRIRNDEIGEKSPVDSPYFARMEGEPLGGELNSSFNFSFGGRT